MTGIPKFDGPHICEFCEGNDTENPATLCIRLVENDGSSYVSFVCEEHENEAVNEFEYLGYEVSADRL